MKKIKVGVIGVGYWGKKHVEEYSKNSNVELKAISDLSDENLEFCKKTYGVKNTTKDYNEILSESIDAVSICTVNKMHFTICKKALEAGKHVLVEKPMTLNSKEAYELIDIAKRENLNLCVGHLFRFNNALIKVRNLIRSNFFGKLGIIKLRWTDRRDPINDVDIIFDLAPHAFDILNFITDKWPKTITCKAGMFRRENPEEWAFIIPDFGDNLVAHVEINWLFPDKKRDILIAGLNRTAKINCLDQSIMVYESGYPYKIDVERNNTLGDELSHFINTINDKKIKPFNDGTLGAKTIEMIEKCFESQKRGSTVEI